MAALAGRPDLRRIPRTRAAQHDSDVSLIHGSAQGQPCQLCVRKRNTVCFLAYQNEHGAPRPPPKTTTASLCHRATFARHRTARLTDSSSELPKVTPKQGKVTRGPWSSRPQPCTPCHSSGVRCRGGKPRDALFST